MHTLQDPNDLLCYSGIALASIPPNTWVLGDAFMHNHYTVFDFGNAAERAASNNSGSSGGPRVGIGKLTTAEQALAAELYQQGLASKSSGAMGPACAVCSVLALLLAAGLAVIFLDGAAELSG